MAFGTEGQVPWPRLGRGTCPRDPTEETRELKHRPTMFPSTLSPQIPEFCMGTSLFCTA